MATEADLAYMAGIIDGEGCIRARLGRGVTPYVTLVVANTNRVLIDWLLQTFSGHVWEGKRPGHWKRTWYWEMSSGPFFELIPRVRPYLKLKGGQADLAVQLIRTVGPDVFVGRPGIKGRMVRPEVVEARKALVAKFRELNKRGIDMELTTVSI